MNEQEKTIFSKYAWWSDLIADEVSSRIATVPRELSSTSCGGCGTPNGETEEKITKAFLYAGGSCGGCSGGGCSGGGCSGG
jgi:hypothetical protein